MGESVQGLAEPLLARLSGVFSAQELGQVRKAYEVADACHQGQWRLSGDPYITHPVAVAELAAAARLDCTMVCAALLHDVIEDTGCDPALLLAEFGGEITSLVEKHTAFHCGREEPDDDRVVTLRLLDRLHNMRTIEHVPRDKQLRKSQEALDLFVPHAQRLGLPVIAGELQELAHHRLRILAGHATSQIRAPLRALRLGSLVLPPAARARYVEEWAAELGALADPRCYRRFAGQLLLGLPRLSIMLRKQDWHDRSAAALQRAAAGRLTRSGLKVLHWVLRSEIRSWALLTPLVAWVVAQTARANLGDAVATLITLPSALATGTNWLRARLGITQRHHSSN